MTTKAIQSKVNLLGIGRDEIRTLKAVYELRETFTKELTEKAEIGNENCIRKYLYRLQEEDLIRVSKLHSNRKYVEPTIEGIKRLEEEGEI